MKALDWLQEWYTYQCDGDWEHMYGIRLTSQGDQGWRLHISLEETALEGATAREECEGVGYQYVITSDAFDGRGDHVGVLIDEFRRWALETLQSGNLLPFHGPLTLMEWFSAQNRPPQESEPVNLDLYQPIDPSVPAVFAQVMEIQTLDNPGWEVEMLAPQAFAPIKIEREEWDWIHVQVKDGVFSGFGGSRNLVEILEVYEKMVNSKFL